MELIKVVCGVIYKEGDVFLCRRKPHKALGGFWEFPGGKVESQESNENCLERELMEELGMKVHILNHLKTIIHDYGSFKIELIAYLCNFIDATFNLVDHDAYEWIKIADLTSYNLAPADIPIVEMLQKK